jgi:AAHS family 4-hydroxybenzoate transporter-like MFS transporter
MAVDLVALIDDQEFGPSQIRLVALCFAIMVTYGYNVLAVGIVAPSLAQALHIAKPSLGLIFAAEGLGAMLGAALAGPLADRAGRRRLVIASTVWYGICALLAARATSSGQLGLVMFAAGLGLGGAYPNTIALMSELAPLRTRATMIATAQTGFALGAASSGVIFAWLVDKYGWRFVFDVGGLAPILLAPILLAWLPESIGWLFGKGARGSTIISALSLVNPQVRFPPDTTFFIREERRAGPVAIHLFRDRRALGTALLWIAFLTNAVAVNFLAVWLTTLITIAGMTVRTAAWAAVAFHSGSIAGAVCIGRFADLRGIYRILPIALATGAVVAWLTGFAGSSPPLMLALSAGMGFCIAGGQFGLGIAAASYYPTYIRATGVSFAYAFGKPGVVVSSLLGTLFLTWRWPLPLIFLADGTFALCAAAAIFAIGASQHRSTLTAVNGCDRGSPRRILV